MKFQDLTGNKYNHLTVLKRAPNQGKNTMWECRCDCGNITTVSAPHLKSGHTKSCGCLHKETMRNMMQTHGLTHHPLYRVYRGIVDRTTLETCQCYKDYGGRGIKMCQEWADDFEAFYQWAMSHGYEKGLTIDRIDTNGDYCPENCRWVTHKVQQNNRRNNRLLEHNGEVHTMSEWSDILEINYHTLAQRLNVYHWSVEKALSNGTL